jgi:hypothetical protein
MRRWARQLAPVATAGALVWFLGATVPWLLIWWSAVSVVFLLGWIAGHNLGYEKGASEGPRWEALADQLDDALREAEATIERLNGNVEVLSRNVVEAYKNGQVDGQLFQAERDQWGLT